MFGCSMKRIIIVVLSMLCMAAHAQKISVDRIEEDGLHQIMTTTKKFKVDGVAFDIGMKIFEGKHKTSWYLLVSTYHSMAPSCEVVIKLGNCESLCLPCKNLNVGKIDTPGYGIPIGSITKIYPSGEAEYFSAIFELTPNIINKIEEHGIIKLRISTGTEFLDREYIKNQLGSYLEKCRSVILKKMKNSSINKDILDDF